MTCLGHRMSEPRSPFVRSNPQNGDVVVTRESASDIRFTVRQLPGAVQFSAAARNDAVRLARTFAQKHTVDVWYCERGTTRLLDAFRRESDGRRTQAGLPRTLTAAVLDTVE